MFHCQLQAGLKGTLALAGAAYDVTDNVRFGNTGMRNPAIYAIND
jgi:hypothetical protein